ncbi:hypothetical protein LQV63_13600 [Paenibacillus profundus]|uniref:Uncharacterized protein n=1 Tax=Paenibacillus profundus TaxID=1173085 RepID=A0ABS8YJ42_9BACL|nr:hypothetical protein [Paenibacillus profundus]MCE5170346.1 hypothetical protein [Paenibacillus profundus]
MMKSGSGAVRTRGLPQHTAAPWGRIWMSLLLRTTLFACIGFVFTGICALMGSDQALRDAE